MIGYSLHNAILYRFLDLIYSSGLKKYINSLSQVAVFYAADSNALVTLARFALRSDGVIHISCRSNPDRKSANESSKFSCRLRMSKFILPTKASSPSTVMALVCNNPFPNK